MRTSTWWQWPWRLALLGVFAAWLGYCSTSPSYRHLDDSLATIKFSVYHAGLLLGECQERTADELAQLPANMRTPLVCPRERSPIQLELALDGRTILSETLQARGIHHDGRASIYRRISVPAGTVSLTVRMKDHIAQVGFPYTAHLSTKLAAGSNLVIDFDGEAGKFVFINGGKPVEITSDERTTLKNALNDLEAGDGQHEDHREVDEVAIG